MSHTSPSLWRHNVAAIITDDEGNILLGGNPQRSDHWHLPQGGVKSGESSRQALHRELQEEVGLQRYTILAEYAGLRYEYRHKNEKSKRWLGQQQVYYLLHTPGISPAADCSGSAEFSATRWVPRSRLSAKLFPRFKRTAIMSALEHFFPAGGGPDAAAISPQLYLSRPGQLPPEPPGGTPLFAGGKAEAEYHLAHLPTLRPDKKDRLLAVVVGLPGAGLKKALRNIAHTLDALTTHYHVDARRYANLPGSILPLPGELSVLALPADAAEVPLLPQLLNRAQAEGVRVLCVALHLSAAAQLRRLAEKGKAPKAPWAAAWQAMQHALAALPCPVSTLPADRAWYRDYLLTLLMETFITEHS